MKKILSDMDGFESFFTLSEGEVSGWVRDGKFLRESPPVDWCMVFSFGFEKPPMNHYYLLLHDLRNHFPRLVDKLRRFESKMKELCPRYSELLRNVIKAVYEEAGRITTDIPSRSVITEVVVMSLAGYNEWSYPNERAFLEEKKMHDNVKRLKVEISNKYHDLIISFNNVRKEALSITRDVKEVSRILHIYKLPGKCKLI